MLLKPSYHADCIIHDAIKFAHRISTEHGDAGLSEIGYSLEYRCRSKMTADMKDALKITDTCNTLLNLMLEGKNTFIKRYWRQLFTRLEKMLDLTEYPRTPKGSSSDHDGIHAITLEVLLGYGC